MPSVRRIKNRSSRQEHFKLHALRNKCSFWSGKGQLFGLVLMKTAMRFRRSFRCRQVLVTGFGYPSSKGSLLSKAVSEVKNSLKSLSNDLLECPRFARFEIG